MITTQSTNYLTYYSIPRMLCLVVCTLFCGTNITNAQGSEGVGINTTTIDPNAILDIRNSGSGTFKGVKMPFLPASNALPAMDGANPGIMFFDSESNQLYNSIVDDNGANEWDPAGWGMRGTPNTDVNKHWIGTTDNVGFNIGTNNSSRIRVRANGKVGIGLTNPSELLEVNGAIKIGSADNSNPGTIQWTGSDLELYKDTGWISLTNTSSGDNDWLIGNSIYNLTNNIGIGTGSPSNKLGVAGGVAIGSSFASTTTTATNGLNVEGNVGIGTAGSNTTSLHITNAGTNNMGILNLQEGVASGTGVAQWNINNMSTNGAKVGLWATTNSAGTGGRYGILNQVSANSSSTADIFGIYSDVDGAGSSSVYGLRLFNDGTGTGTDYGVYSTGEDINYFEGSLGIGTDAPAAQLHLAHPSGVSNGFTLQNTYDTDTWHWYVYTTNDLTLRFNGSQKGSFDDVSGNYTATSDRRLKKNITPVGGVLNNLMKLNLVEYNYKQQSDKRKYTGFIAQEVKDIFPSLVYYQDEDDLFLMDYAGVGPLAVKAIQEQQIIIEKLQEKVLMLENKIAQMDDE